MPKTLDQLVQETLGGLTLANLQMQLQNASLVEQVAAANENTKRALSSYDAVMALVDRSDARFEEAIKVAEDAIALVKGRA